MKRTIAVLGIGLLVSVGALAQGRTQQPATEQPTTSPQPAGTSGRAADKTTDVTLKDAKGQSVGTAELRQTPHGVLVRLELQNIPAGPHAFHIHETGRCEPPSFESAGGHFEPGKRQHGFLEKSGPHAGDIPNIDVPKDGRLTVEYLVPDVTLDTQSTSLLDADGSALVIHAKPDDYRSQPSGNAGDRIACGEIAK